MQYLKSGIIKCILFLILMSALSCQKAKPLSAKDKAYVESVQAWQQERIKTLQNKDGWLSLAGLFWLKPGENTFGADKVNDLIFPKENSPAFIGTFILDNNQVSVKIAQNVTVLCNEKPVTSMSLVSDMDGDPSILTYKSLSWYLIKRGDRYGIRLKDSESENFKNFKGIDRYDIDPRWNIAAQFEPYDPPKKITVPNVLGNINKENCPGALVFQINNKTYRLDPIAEPGDDSFFIIFADETTGKQTYGGGRFLVVNAPDKDGNTHIDFNKAYNPPCVFTPYATCPLPPDQNRLDVEITAGEKFSGHD